MKNILITGVSSGIGLACSKVFISKGFRVFGSVRKNEDAERVTSELGSGFHPLIMDVTDQLSIKSAAAEVSDMIGNEILAGLINNAGIARYGPLMHLPLDDLRYQYEVNVIGQLGVTQTFLPLLGAGKKYSGKPGRIIMVSSVSGKIAYPFLGPYASSKFALEGLSDALRRELQLYNIPLIIIEPGRVQSEIWYKIDENVINEIRKTDYSVSLKKISDLLVSAGRTGIPAEILARKVYRIFMKKNPKVRYVIVPNRFRNWILPRLLPTKIFDRLIAKRLGLT